jgi:hypothetical protein
MPNISPIWKFIGSASPHLDRLLGGSKTTPAPANSSFASCGEWENQQQKWGLVIVSTIIERIHGCPHFKIYGLFTSEGFPTKIGFCHL